jgi:hypothetical protein
MRALYEFLASDSKMISAGFAQRRIAEDGPDEGGPDIERPQPLAEKPGPR